MLTGRVVSVSPTSDRCEMAADSGEVRAHRHDGYVAPASFAPRRDIARPFVFPAHVLLDELEAERIGIPSEFGQSGRDPLFDLGGFGLRG